MMDARKHHHLDFQQKVPIPLSPKLDLYTFPTESPTSHHCMWLFFHAIESINATSGGTQVILINNTSLLLEQSYHTIQKQYDRAGMCKVVFAPTTE